MFYGQFQDGNWGSDTETTRFKSYMEIPTEKWVALLCEAESQGKIIGPDTNGNPVMVSPPEPSKSEKATFKIRELKEYLASTDYIVIKIAEGAATHSDYTEVLSRRAAARAEINECQRILKTEKK